MINHAIAEAAAAGLRPPATGPAWQWMARNVRIANSERASFYDIDQTPWWRRPIESMTDRTTREILVMAPTGSGKSAMAEALFCYVIAEDPGPAMYASQTDATAKYWAETRFAHAVKSCKAIEHLWPKDKNKARDMEIIFPHMPFVVTGAKISSFQEKSMRWLFGDERWRWKAGFAREWRARHHNRWNRKVISVSQGGSKGDDLHADWIAFPQWEFGWRCACGSAQPYSHSQLVFDSPEGATIAERAATVRRVCPSCGKEHADTARQRRALADSNTDNGMGGYLHTGGGTARDSIAYRVDRGAVWWVAWADDVAEHLAATAALKIGNIAPLRQWIQKNRAEFWSEDETAEEADLPLGQFSSSDFEGQKTEGEVVRFMTIDPGKNHFWCVVAAWSDDGRCRVIADEHALREGELIDIAQRFGVPPECVFLDLGYEWQTMVDMCARNKWRGIRGDGNADSYQTKAGTSTLYTKAKMARGTQPGTGCRWVLIASDSVKDILQKLLQTGMIQVHANASPAFRKHMSGEVREMVTQTSTGKERRVWRRRWPNHLWDCMAYQVSCALMFGCLGQTV